jgi:sugar phosphate permease
VARCLTAREIGIVLAAAIWAKVFATAAMGAIADRSGSRRAVIVALCAVALVSYAAM